MGHRDGEGSGGIVVAVSCRHFGGDRGVCEVGLKGVCLGEMEKL
jgi:hypothetical protein